MPTRKTIKKLFVALPNIGRGISPMLFNAVVFFVLKHRDDNTLLAGYSWLMVTANLFVTFTGWGLRDFVVREYVKDLSSAPLKFSIILSGKVPLLLISMAAIYFIPSANSFKLALLALVVVRTFVALTDPIILSYDFTRKLFLAESIIYLSAIVGVILSKRIYEHLFFLVIVIEITRFVAACLLIRRNALAKVKWTNPFSYLYETRYYFLIALFSFCMSKADLVFMGVVSRGYSFADYTIITNLVTFSQIIIASVYNSNIKSVFRLPYNTAYSALNKLSGQFLFLSVAATLSIVVISRCIYMVEFSPVFYVFLFANVFLYCVTLKYVFILNHLQKPAYFLAASFISSCTNIGGSVLLVPLLATTGALMANTAGVVVLILILSIVVPRKKFHFVGNRADLLPSVPN